MDCVQLYISWLNKVDVLTSFTSFSQELTSINQKNLIIGYFFSITYPFDKTKENILFFYLFGQIWSMCNCTYHESITPVVLKSPGSADFALVAILIVSGYSNEVW